jgi:hypothetical protein
VKKVKVDREYPSLSILCSMYGAAKDPDGMNGYYGSFGTAACEAYNKACQELGQRIHTKLEDWELDRQSNILTDQREHSMAKLIWQWINESGMKAVDCSFSENGKAIEVKLDSKLLNYSCRVDRIVTFGNDPTKWIGDYKTSSEISDQYKMQLAGYAWGWYEKTGEWIDQGFLLRAEKSPKKKQQLEVVEVHNLSMWIEPLCLLRSLWDYQCQKGEYAPKLCTSISG